MMRSGGRILLVACLLAWAGALPLSAAGVEDLAETVSVHGFVSQGYLNTDEVDYLVPASRAGSAEFLEVALTVTARPMERLHIGAQFLARDFGDIGNGQVALDWGYGDFRWRDALGFRAGKVKLPYGFYNEQRDLDMLRTTVFLPQSVYNEQTRDFVLAYQGAGLYGSHDFDGPGAVDYHVFGGTLDVADPASGIWGEQFGAVAATLAPAVATVVEQENGLAPGSARASVAGVVNPQVVVDYIWGGALIWETPWKPLRAGATLLAGRFRNAADLRYDVMIDGQAPGEAATYQPYTLSLEEESEIDHVVTVSAEINWDDLRLAAEYSEEAIDSSTSDAWYVQADYRVARPLALAAYYSAYYDNKDDHAGAALETVGLPGYYGWQKDLTLAARVDLTDFWLIKAEIHFIDGVLLSAPRGLPEELEDTKPRNWTMFAAKTTFYF